MVGLVFIDFGFKRKGRIEDAERGELRKAGRERRWKRESEKGEGKRKETDRSN